METDQCCIEAVEFSEIWIQSMGYEIMLGSIVQYVEEMRKSHIDPKAGRFKPCEEKYVKVRLELTKKERNTKIRKLVNVAEKEGISKDETTKIRKEREKENASSWRTHWSALAQIYLCPS